MKRTERIDTGQTKKLTNVDSLQPYNLKGSIHKVSKASVFVAREKDLMWSCQNPNYLSIDSNEKACKILKEYHGHYQTFTFKLDKIKTGLQSNAIVHLIDLSGTNQRDIAHLLSLSEPTIRKYIKEGKHLNTGLSEHILELFELYEKGMDTFGSLEEFRNWLPHYNSGIERKPIDLLDTITGIRVVMDELTRIDHGILA
jgi:putative toxin-antitoxin system antitoxin component (TIGR02293 family)